MKENVRNAGLILALIIAGASLPTSIMSFTSRPTTPITEVNNYYYNTTIIEQYNTTIIEQYNTTIIINNTIITPPPEPEPLIDRSKLLENHTFTISTATPYYILEYNISKNEILFFENDPTTVNTLNVHIIQKPWLDIWNNTNREIGQFYTIDNSQDAWSPPFEDIWFLVFAQPLGGSWTEEFTIYDEIKTITESEPIINRSKPIELHHFWSNTTHPYYMVKYNLSQNEIYYLDCIDYSMRAQTKPEIHIIQESWLESYLNYDVGEFYYGFSGGDSITWEAPFLDTWCILFSSNDPYLPNNWDWQFYDQLTTIME